MDLLSIFMGLMYWFDDAFSPIYFMLFCAVVLVFHDWWNSYGSLPARLVTVFGSWGLAWIIYNSCYWLYPVHPQWYEDAFAVAGLALAIVIIITVWKLKGYGNEMIGGIISALAVTIPYTVISPLWNISGHVAYTASPVIYLHGISRRWRILYVIPLIMTINRPIVEAHTIPQSIGGLVLSFLAVTGLVYYYRKENERRKQSGNMGSKILQF